MPEELTNCPYDESIVCDLKKPCAECDVIVLEDESGLYNASGLRDVFDVETVE